MPKLKPGDPLTREIIEANIANLIEVRDLAWRAHYKRMAEIKTNLAVMRQLLKNMPS